MREYIVRPTQLWQYLVGAGVVIALSALFAGTIAFSGHRPTSAASTCPQSPTPPQFNVVYCGLDGPADSDLVTSFRNYYNSNNDGHGHTDLQAVYNWAGANGTMVSGMTTSNTMLGTIYRNGNITVNGQVVGTNAWVAGRWNDNGAAGFVNVEGDVWARAATTYLSSVPQVPILVHFNDSGQADFAVMTPCGNAVRFTPTPPPAKPSVLTCQLLSATPDGDINTTTYTFTATASAQNAAISTYTFFFGDGSQTPISSSNTTASTTHTYQLPGTYSAYVVINGSVTSSTCQTKVTIPQPSNLACKQLTAAEVGSTMEFNFTAVATAQNATITSYNFDFGDSTTKTINTDATQVSTSHTYGKAGPYTASVTINGSASAVTCSAQVTVPAPPAPVAPPPTPTPPPAKPLPNTGPGEVIGLFGITSTIGGFVHHFFVKRRQLGL